MESVILIYSTVKMIELKNCNDIRKFNFNVFYFETYSLEWAEYVSSPQASLSWFSLHMPGYVAKQNFCYYTTQFTILSNFLAVSSVHVLMAESSIYLFMGPVNMCS